MPNYIDIVLMAILAFFLIRAMVRGFIREVLGLLGLVVAVIISAMTYVPLAELLQSITGAKGNWWYAVAFVLVLMSIFVIFSYIGSLIGRLAENGPFSLLDRLLGGLAGLVKGILLTYLLINLLLLVTYLRTPDMLRDSVVAPHIVNVGSRLIALVPFDLTRTLQERSGLLSPAKDQNNEKTE